MIIMATPPSPSVKPSTPVTRRGKLLRRLAVILFTCSVVVDGVWWLSIHYFQHLQGASGDGALLMLPLAPFYWVSPATLAAAAILSFIAMMVTAGPIRKLIWGILSIVALVLSYQVLFLILNG